MSFELNDKVAVVTGAGTGIGRETALACAREGARLALCDVNEVAVRILRAVRHNKAVAPITPEAHLGYALSRYLPPVSRWLAAKTATAAE